MTGAEMSTPERQQRPEQRVCVAPHRAGRQPVDDDHRDVETIRAGANT